MQRCWCAGNCPHLRQAAPLLRRENRAAAEIAVRRALLVAPDCPQANRLMGLFCTQNNQAVFGTPHFTRALERDDSELLFAQAGWNLRSRGDVDGAIAMFRRGLELHRKSFLIYDGLVTALELAGKYAAAEREISTASRIPHNGKPFPLRRHSASLAANAGDVNRAIAILAADDLDHLELSDRGRYLDRAGRYQEAWDDWMRAKAFLRDHSKHHYDADRAERQVDGLRHAALQIPELAPGAPYTWPGGPFPRALFVGGFPRSGTTLLETVLTQHPAIAAGDELPFLNEILELMPIMLGAPAAYPDAMGAFRFGINAGAQEAMRSHYLRRSYAKIGIVMPLSRQCPSFFTDKMPLHEMHLGLISILLPESVFFYVRRHPLDILISSMSHYLVHGHFYASSLESAAYHYVLLDRLHEFYRAHLPYAQNRLREIRYERLVTDLDATIPKIFDHLALEPVAAVRSPHENRRHSRTISHDQVRRPIYSSSVDRWRPYLPMLADVLPSLREIAAREGYSLR